MNVIKAPIDGVAIIEPRLFKDARGFVHGFSVLSEKDKVYPKLQDAECLFDSNISLGL
ncbi:hypothetical protein AALN73_02315 [Bacteroides stercorirosoris]|jgi:hypothetical protein|uniref:hypothetical protein n=1 Tax=Bacteroides stercorirosoris TaxID=871324 RepID=UPI0023F969A5|nr:hypothetical protein [Bacteroides stercorirosoris]